MENLSDIQTKVLNIYREFKKICEKHNLRFFAIQGSTLGAIFWDGFIPWDDDMDIAMPFDDFKKFKKFANELPSNLCFKEYLWIGGKIYDDSTTLIEPDAFGDYKEIHGVFLDITILAGLPNNEQERLRFMDKFKVFEAHAIMQERYKDTEHSIQDLIEERNVLLSKYPFGSTKFLTDFPMGSFYCFMTKGFLNPEKHVFHDTDVFISSTYDFDLKSRYGKYEKYPPKNTRFNHSDNSFLDLNHPASFYTNEFLKLPEWIKKLVQEQNVRIGVWYKNTALLNEYSKNLKNVIKSQEEAIAKKDDIINSYNNTLSKRIKRKIKRVIRCLKNE